MCWGVFYVCLPVSNGSACVFAMRASSHGVTCCELVFLEAVSKHEKRCYLTLAVCIRNETPECAEMKRRCCSSSSSSCSLSPALHWVPTWCDPNKRSELRDEWSNIFPSHSGASVCDSTTAGHNLFYTLESDRVCLSCDTFTSFWHFGQSCLT